MHGNNQDTLQDIVQKVVLEAPIQKVWEAVSSSEGIAAWFMPNDFQPKIGYEFHLQSPFGPSPCKVLELDPPNRLSFAWDVEGWVVSFELQDLNGKTQFTLTHSGWGAPDAIAPKAQQKNSIIRDTMNGGWEKIVHVRLKQAVEK
ncbi:SRPBCC domain-containing protein [Aneurinibacillus sp. Ricciae_BoGa-3]|uniref:SRPBCC family protein n=1 Tax=Aneurinibacillus sp. Ricciae_BoGa-3 TaxID=3022697 RepID=UPI002341A725|nr:SRPBCC domain-containing protein [Aneurinibacillus sp. Ricciae_BoGa-3]WCK56079.1 SRPBCC domain-containing protein [Aneurinibacillus sp. Ricciae_BoGa-3]